MIKKGLSQPFNPETDSVVYKSIIDLAVYYNVRLTWQFKEALYNFAMDIEQAFQEKLEEERFKPPPPFIAPDGKTYIFKGKE